MHRHAIHVLVAYPEYDVQYGISVLGIWAYSVYMYGCVHTNCCLSRSTEQLYGSTAVLVCTLESLRYMYCVFAHELTIQYRELPNYCIMERR